MAGVDLAECELRWSDPPAPVCQAATAPKARVRARRAGFGGRLAEASPDMLHSIHEIAEEESIPEKFLEGILVTLKNALTSFGDLVEDEHQIDTVPPPPGEDDAYSAETRIGKIPSDLLQAMKRAHASEAGRSSLPPDLMAASPGSCTLPRRLVVRSRTKFDLCKNSSAKLVSTPPSA